jgi:hypothetical protein
MRKEQGLILQHAVSVCDGHAHALAEALEDLAPALPLAPEKLDRLHKMERRLLDQFARLPLHTTSRRYGPTTAPGLARRTWRGDCRPAGDRPPDRLEQLGWLPSADEWLTLRQVRNEFFTTIPMPPRNGPHDWPPPSSERKG